MKQKQNNMEQYGILDVTRDERKQVKRKTYSDEENDENDIIISKNKISKTTQDDSLLKRIKSAKQENQV